MTTNLRINAPRRRPIVEVRISKQASPQGNTPQVTRHAIVDTGFTGGLALPWSVITSLGLNHTGIEDLVLADGNKKPFKTFDGFASVQRIEKRVTVYEMSNESLLGMSFLNGLQLIVTNFPGGTVVIQHPP